jgi:MoxR-like ATPase
MHTNVDIEALNHQVAEDGQFIARIYAETSKVIVGQKHMIDRLLLALLANGHILLEGLPGLAKTLSIKTLASSVNGSFSRIQFTPDLLPSDIVGTMIYNPAKAEFTMRKGPVFANFILADEINRAPAKVQSALLEAMQERQVTIGNETHSLPTPFLVLATQNPIEQEGTYTLPEAQVDRFMFKVVIGYPSREEERIIMQKNVLGEISQKINAVVDSKEIIKARETVQKIYMDEKIENYILDIVFATREPQKFGLDSYAAFIQYGASPRASINIALAARAHAFMQQRGFVIPDDVRAVCADVLRHRIGMSYEAEAESMTTDKLIEGILQRVKVP